MPDMLVKLYELPPLEPALATATAHGIDVRRAIAPEKNLVVQWIHKHFGGGWAAECDVAFAHEPVGCFIAVRDGALIGFCCHDATARNFLGPMGVLESARGGGIGKALLLASLHAQRAMGYGYAIIGWVGPAEFYQKSVGAKIIEGSTPGIYRGMLTS